MLGRSTFITMTTALSLLLLFLIVCKCKIALANFGRPRRPFEKSEESAISKSILSLQHLISTQIALAALSLLSLL